MTPRMLAVVCLAAGLVFSSTVPGGAHKGITSPFTYNDDVYPILRDRCGRCHVTGGIAPMSLLSHSDAVPWAVSIRNELLAGHMPPGVVDGAASRVRHMPALSAREMNVVLTWAAGGTPVGTPEKSPPPATYNPAWSLGQPDLSLPLPVEGALAAGERERTLEFVLPTGTSERRWLRAVDLLPGNATMVRAATIAVRDPAIAGTTTGIERTLALWLPGMDAIPLDGGVGFELPPSAELVVRLFYRKTWEFENREVRDRSIVGLYFAREPAATLEAVRLAPPWPAGAASGAFSHVLADDVRVLGLYPETGLENVRVRVVATRPDRTRVDLIAFHPRREWVRRYWFREPIVLPRGTEISVTAVIDDDLSLSVGSRASPMPLPTDLPSLGLTLNVISGR